VTDEQPEPRQVTCPNGDVRWQGCSGATFATREEALGDEPPQALDFHYEPRIEKKGLSQRIVGGLLVAWLTIPATAAAVMLLAVPFGKSPLPLDTVVIELIFGLLTGTMALIGWAILLDMLTGKQWDAQEKVAAFAERVFGISGGVLKFLALLAVFLIVAGLAIFVAVWLSHSMFEGVSKGQALIIVLLGAILLVLVSQKR